MKFFWHLRAIGNAPPGTKSMSFSIRNSSTTENFRLLVGEIKPVLTEMKRYKN